MERGRKGKREEEGEREGRREGGMKGGRWREVEGYDSAGSIRSRGEVRGKEEGREVRRNNEGFK